MKVRSLVVATLLATAAAALLSDAIAGVRRYGAHGMLAAATPYAKQLGLADEIRATHQVTVTVVAQDLSEPTGPATLLAELERQHLDIDVLVNNAGSTMDGHYLTFGYDAHRTYQQLMCLTPAELTYGLLPGMLRRQFGQVVNVASIAGLIPSRPFNSLYGPCKSHMVVLTRTLQLEYGNAGVTFSTCCPGPVADTPIVTDSAHGQAWGRFRFLLSKPRRVVEKAYAAVENGKTVQLLNDTRFDQVLVFGRR